MTQSSLRERLEAKRRRTVTETILVADPEPLVEAVETASNAYAAALVNGQTSDDERASLEANLVRAQTELGETVVQVQFQKLPDADFELLVGEFTIDDEEHGAVIDEAALLPELAAACAIDEELQDADWWADLLARDEWSAAEKHHLYFALFNTLHRSLPAATLGKG